MSFGGLLFFGIAASLANFIGGLLITAPGSTKLNNRALKYLVALGAGFMLAAIFIEILPETFRIWAQQGGNDVIVFPMTLLLGGYLLIQLFEHTLAPHF